MANAYFETEDAGMNHAAFFFNASWDTPYPVAAHWHHHIEALYPTEGRVTILLNGETFTLGPGELVQFNPRDIHAVYRADGEPFRYYVLRLPVPLFYPEARDAFLASHILPFARKIPPKMQRLDSALTERLGIAGHIRQMEAEEDAGRPLYLQAIGSYCSLVYLAVLRHWAGAGLVYSMENELQNVDTDAGMTRLEPCFSYLAEHFCETVAAEDLAAVCHMSYSYFAKLFKRLAGVPVSEYITFLRIEEAERMLLGEACSVTQVAAATGFKDTSYFITAFKQRKGYTPKQYQKKFEETI